MDQSGKIFNPGYPNSSRISNNCEWRISANPGEIILLNIKQFDARLGRKCKTDYIEILDGYGNKSRLLGRYCRTLKPPQEITSSGNRLLIKTRIKGRFLFTYKGNLTKCQNYI